MSTLEQHPMTKRRYLLGNCLGMAILALTLVIGLFVSINFYTHHGEEIIVPDVCGQSIDVATRKLEALGLRVEVADTGYVASKAADEVLEQNIAPNTKVKQMRLIRLTINSGTPRQVTLPDIADNCSAREAEFKLRNLGFKLTPPEYITGDKDWVYGIKVQGKQVVAGQHISVMQPLTLVLGDGSNEDEFNGNDTLDYLYFHHDEKATEEETELFEE